MRGGNLWGNFHGDWGSIWKIKFIILNTRALGNITLPESSSCEEETFLSNPLVDCAHPRNHSIINICDYFISPGYFWHELLSFHLQAPDVATMETTDSSIYIRLIRKYIFYFNILYFTPSTFLLFKLFKYMT